MTLTIPLKDSSRAITIVFKFLLCEMNLNGLRILKRRSTFITGKFIPEKLISTMEQQTIKKSN